MQKVYHGLFRQASVDFEPTCQLADLMIRRSGGVELRQPGAYAKLNR